MREREANRSFGDGAHPSCEARVAGLTAAGGQRAHGRRFLGLESRQQGVGVGEGGDSDRRPLAGDRIWNDEPLDAIGRC